MIDCAVYLVPAPRHPYWKHPQYLSLVCLCQDTTCRNRWRSLAVYPDIGPRYIQAAIPNVSAGTGSGHNRSAGLATPLPPLLRPMGIDHRGTHILVTEQFTEKTRWNSWGFGGERGGGGGGIRGAAIRRQTAGQAEQEMSFIPEGNTARGSAKLGAPL